MFSEREELNYFSFKVQKKKGRQANVSTIFL